MANNPLKSSFAKFGDLLNTNSRFKRAIERNRKTVERFIENNAYLLSKENISVYRQLKNISKETGFNISQAVYSQIKTGKRKVCSKAIIWVISDYWDLDAIEMETRNFAEEDRIKSSAA